MADVQFDPVETNLTYDQAVSILDENIKDPAIRAHCREAEVIMRAMARHFGQDEEQWAVLGLLHDVDFEHTKDTPNQHCVAQSRSAPRSSARATIPPPRLEPTKGHIGARRMRSSCPQWRETGPLGPPPGLPSDTQRQQAILIAGDPRKRPAGIGCCPGTAHARRRVVQSTRPSGASATALHSGQQCACDSEGPA